MDGFVGQFQTALQVTSPKKRMFLLDWMGVSQHPNALSLCRDEQHCLEARN